MKHVYNIYNLRFKSSLKLLSIFENNENHDIEILPYEENLYCKKINWFHSTNINSKPWLSYGRNEQYIFLRFHNLVDFAINNSCNKINYLIKNGLDLNSLHHIVLDQVIPRVLTLDNNFLLHASAVGIGDETVAFIGMSGSGKSTIATYLCLNNCELMSDDALLIFYKSNEYFGSPSYPGLRLWPDMVEKLFKKNVTSSNVSNFKNKQLLPALENSISFSNKEKKIKALYLLKNAENFSIEKISPFSAFGEIIKHVVRLDITDEKTNIEQFNFVNKIMNNVDLYKINYNKTLDSLEKIHFHIKQASNS